VGANHIEYNSTRAILLWAQPVTGLLPGITNHDKNVYHFINQNKQKQQGGQIKQHILATLPAFALAAFFTGSALPGTNVQTQQSISPNTFINNIEVY